MNIKISKIVLAFFVFLVFSAPVQAADFETGVFPGSYADYGVRTEHFQIEFDQIISVQPDTDHDGIPDVVEEVAEYAEYSWDFEVESMGWESPIEDGEKVFIILDDDYEYLYAGMVGATSAFYDGTIYFAVDAWLSDDIMKVTVAHEFLHCIQFGYNLYFVQTDFDVNFAETSAVWIEDMVYDEVDDYINYLPGYFSYTDYSIFASYAESSYTYALNIWHRFLTDYYGDTDIIKDAWEEYFDLGSVGAGGSLTVYTATEAAIEVRGDNIDEVYQEFSVWNLAHDQTYEEGVMYPDVEPIRVWNSYPVSGQTVRPQKWPALYGANYIAFDVSGGDDFKFELTKTEPVAMGVTFVPKESDGTYDLDAVEKNIVDDSNNYAEFVFENASDYDYIYAIVSPLGLDYSSGADVFDMGYTYYYSAEFGDFNEEEEIIADVEVDTEETSGQKEWEGEDVIYVRGSEDFNLEVLDYDDKSITLSWNRVTAYNVDYYLIGYGEAPGEYTGEKEVSQAWTTVSTVSGLDSDSIYYFLVEGYSEDGELLVSSEEVGGFTADFSFTDLPSTNEAYEAVMGLYELGIIQGYDDGTFRAGDSINRAEFLKILVEGIGITPDSGEYGDCFSDVGSDWYAPYVCYAKEQGWVSGYSDGSFKPAQEVNKVEALKMLLQVFGYDLDESDDVSGGLPYAD
ncbi:MAG: hypothetical protein ACD_65C00134G0001, partial [uncultured bacterium]